jgi:hypothetical protein
MRPERRQLDRGQPETGPSVPLRSSGGNRAKSPPRWEDTGREGGSETTWLLMNFGAGVIIVAAITLALIQTAWTHGPRPGDIITFSTARLNESAPPLAVTRFAPDGTEAHPCVLEPPAMAKAGGSLVVESVEGQLPLYRVRWSGQRSAIQDSGTGCPDGALLGLTRGELEALAQSAGGFGLGDGHVTPAHNNHAGTGTRTTYPAG